MLLNIWPNNTVFRTDNSLISNKTVRSTNGPVGYGNNKPVRVLYLSVIAVIIIAISYISANRLERRSTVAGILGASSTVGVGTGNSNNLSDSNIFRGLLLRPNFMVNSGNIIYIFSYTLISNGIGASGYRV